MNTNDNQTKSPITRRDFLGAVTVAAATVAYAKIAGAESMTSIQSKAADTIGRWTLSDGWKMQASGNGVADGAKISTPDFAAEHWYSVTVPCTVLAGLVANGEYPDLLTADNLKKVPTDRFDKSWWYRRELDVPAIAPSQQWWLYSKGINYRANIWINGKQIANSDTAVGAYRDVELNITDAVTPGKNVLAIEVFKPDKKRDLSITFVDWAPEPPDLNMGLWQDLELTTTGPVTVRYPHVLTDFDTAVPTEAKITVIADVRNVTDKEITGTLTGEIDGQKFSHPVKLAAKEYQRVEISTTLTKPKLWWPWQLGNPDMYQLKLAFAIGSAISDQCSVDFGVRQVKSRLENGHRLFSVNGVDMLILGGGYAPDLLQRRAPADRPSWQEDHIRYVKGMNLNAVRLEGKLEDDAFYSLCDKHGVLVMAGWCCCSPWERWKNWKEEQHTVAMESLKYQIRRARTHPSLLVWLNGSDNHPPADIETEYLAIEADLKWPCPTLSSATAKKSDAAEPTGVKMEGPYRWEPPIYWYVDKTKGGAHGFNTEVGPGPVPPPIESMMAMLTADHYWPPDPMWDFHSGRGVFGTIKDFSGPMDTRFGPSENLADFSWKAQAQAYETIKAMYEAFRRNKFNATGEIQWMLNNAWPCMIWHLYDYYFRPGGAYFATRLACEPIHILYSYDNNDIAVSNDTLADMDVTALAEIYSLDGKQLHTQTAKCTAKANASQTVFNLDQVKENPNCFLRLQLTGEGGKVVSTNSYWLSNKPDVLSAATGDKNDWNVTYCSSFTDYTALQKLPMAKLELGKIEVKTEGPEHVAKVTVTNNSEAIAMMVRLKLNRSSGGEEILPVRWEDNYFMLLPNEKRTLTARYLTKDGPPNPMGQVQCYNNNRTV